MHVMARVLHESLCFRGQQTLTCNADFEDAGLVLKKLAEASMEVRRVGET